MQVWVAVGAIRGAFGVTGALKVEPYADVESSVLNHVRKWRVGEPQPRDPRSGMSRPGLSRPVADDAAISDGRRLLPFALPAEVTVQTFKLQGEFIIATILPAVTREEALRLKGLEVFVTRADFPEAQPDEYYWADLIGCAVVDKAGVPLGVVVAVDDHGAQSVLRLDGGILIPFVAAHVLEVLPADKRIVADWSADWV